MINRQYYDIKWTNTIEDITQWDLFLKSNPRGHCQQVGHWLMSFKKYLGFDFEILIIRDNKGKIVAGLGILIIGVPYFKVLIAPSGPIITSGNEKLFDGIIQLFIERAKECKTFYCHLNVPILKDNNIRLQRYTLEGGDKNSIFFNGKKGNRFPYVNCVIGFRPLFIDYSKDDDPYHIAFNKFSINTKRNVKKSEKKSLELKYAKTEDDLKIAYKVIEKVAIHQKYTVRSWEKTKDMLLGMIKDDLCFVPCCYADGSIKGVLVIFDIGQRLTYISGGVLRSEEDLKIGHFLHNEMLKLCIKKGYEIYDFSIPGSDGVTRFKKGFGSCNIEFVSPRYWVLNRFKFFLFIAGSKIISKFQNVAYKLINLKSL